ncbi:MAG: glycosyltransferase family 2 protein [Candidatus Omnitrophica bacterium]|nr:glycosyltransferase family 2 protein [Candidatus Omnitrophota bacterium]
MFKNVYLDSLFLFCLVNMWIIILYQAFLVIMAYRFFLVCRQRLEKNLHNFKEYPFVSILIPAHNEEAVIESTLDSMLDLDYPADKLEIFVIDDESTDGTAKILDRYAKEYRRVKPIHVPKGQGRKGKAFALNRATKMSKGDIICIYDADNNPEPNALKYLVAELMSDPKISVVCGKVRTQNRKKNLLTKFINLEFISHQWMVQAGRWYRNKITMIPGTNFVIRKKILNEIGGWDEQALTEDTELTLRILQMGNYVSFNPFAITWEQEPESWGVWQRQRLRWLMGNQYIVKKYMHWSRLRMKNIRQILYMFTVYSSLFVTIVMSDLIFIFGLLNIAHIEVSGPLFLTWIFALLIFVISMAITTSFEETSESTIQSMGLAFLMYFTYCQFWIYLNFKSMYKNFVQKTDKTFWVKTPRVRLKP